MVSAEDAARICRCELSEVRRYRKAVLPRPPSGQPDDGESSVSEVAAMAAGCAVRRWGVAALTKQADPLVARLALKPPNDREWLLVKDTPRGGLREIVPPYTAVGRFGKAAPKVFDPTPYYAEIDRVSSWST